MNYLLSAPQNMYKMISSPAAIKYHGLTNQGATCYLNSVLQVLFMTEDFREAVKKCGPTSENPGTEGIDGHLTSLFDDLKQREASTRKITNKLGITRVYEQQDAAECFEKILGLTSPQASKIFHGQLTHTTKCSACGTETPSDGAFWHLPLELVESYSEDYSVVNGIEEFFRDSDLSGENQMYCDECDDKADAKIKCVMKDHPEVLMLLLKRFEFDYNYMAYVKINCTVHVPYTLQIPENQRYELYAVVDHFGDLRSGHYTANIKSQDDDKWYNFDDSKVTLFDFQLDNFEKSSSAYLLFYRKEKVHAADTCTQDITEVSTPGGFPPAATDIYHQCQDVIEMREKETLEVADMSYEPAVPISIDTNQEAGIKDINAGYSGVKPSGVLDDFSVEGQRVNVRQSLSYSQEACDEERKDARYHSQDAHAKKQRDDRKVVTHDEEDIRGNADFDDPAEKRGTSSRETQLEESVDDRDNDRVRRKRPQEGREDDNILDPSYQRYERGDDPQQVCVDMQRDEDRVVAEVNRDKNGRVEGDEQSERRTKPSAKHLNRDAEHHEVKGFGDVRKDMHEDLGAKQKNLSVDKQGDGLKIKRDVKVDEGKTGANEREVGPGSVKQLTKYDLCSLQDSSSICDTKQNRPQDDQECEQGRSSMYRRHEQLRDDKRDVKEVKEQKTEDDKHANRKETSMTKPNLSRDVEDQDKRRLDNVRQNMNEDLESKQEIGQHHTLKPLSMDEQGNGLKMETDVKVDQEDETGADEREVASSYDLMEQKRGHDKHDKRKETSMTNPNLSGVVEGRDKRRLDDLRQDRPQQKVSAKHSSHKDISVDKQGREQESKGHNKHTHRRAGSSGRQRELTESREVAENRGVGSVEKMLKSQPKARYNDNAVGGKHGSGVYAKKTDTEVSETRRSIKGSSETDLIVKTTDETVRQETLLVGVRNLNVSKSASQEPKQRGTKRVFRNTPEENETQGTSQSIPKKKKKKFNSQEQDVEMKHATERAGEHEQDRRKWWLRLFARQKQNRKEKKKLKKPTGCRISCISPTSESD